MSPSRSSRASWAPVEAPEGTQAWTVCEGSDISTSTVGFPRESRISRAWTAVIFVMFCWVVKKYFVKILLEFYKNV